MSILKLSEIIKGLDIIDLKGNIDVDIENVVFDNRKATVNSLFVCIDGNTVDGHKFALDAIRNGAVALLVQNDVDVPENITVVKISDTRYGLAHTADRFYQHPSGKLKLIGITGTKGKTTTSYMVKAIFEAAGHISGLVGTIQNMIGDEVLYAERTTPESGDLQKIFNEMLENKADICVMEVSSQGLNMDRVTCTEYSSAIFTNLSRDHIGPSEHSSMDDYAMAKAKLFRMCKNGIINVDSQYAHYMIDDATCKLYTYGIYSPNCDFKAQNIVFSSNCVEYDITGAYLKCHVIVNIPGKFSVYNSLAAIACCFLEGIAIEITLEALKKVVIPGRAESVSTGREFSIIIDYAHNPDSFINIITTVKEYAKGRTIFLFGCGGDRNRPRFQMGETAGQYADFSIITSDNPRTEDPESIVRDLEKGIKSTGGEYICIVDRREAIRYAIQNAQPGDVIILAGKGHETYQLFKDKQIHFDEREVVKEILEEMDK